MNFLHNKIMRIKTMFHLTSPAFPLLKEPPVKIAKEYISFSFYNKNKIVAKVQKNKYFTILFLII